MRELSSRVVDQVQALMRGRNMSGRHLAVLAGMPQRTVADKLARRAPFTLDDLSAVCGVLDVEPVDVLIASQQARHPIG
jgi:DNA-binding Xre family transcriptional regulator